MPSSPPTAMVVATNNDSAYQAAFALHDNGVRVPAIVDARNDGRERNCAEASQ